MTIAGLRYVNDILRVRRHSQDSLSETLLADLARNVYLQTPVN